MALADMTREYIRRFAGSTMFERGEGYYRSGNVTDLEYDGDAATITADVEGNYDDYFVRVSEENGMIRANCDCPYDGYPCKHMAAVMLEFAVNKSKYVKKTAKSRRQDRPLEGKVSKLSREELVEMVMDWSRKYPDLKSELMVRFAEDKQQAIASIRKQVNKAFPDIDESYFMTQIAKRLTTLAKQGDSASDDMKAEIYWAIACSMPTIERDTNDYWKSVIGAFYTTMGNLPGGYKRHP